MVIGSSVLLHEPDVKTGEFSHTNTNARSSNGKTLHFGCSYRGSNPRRAIPIRRMQCKPLVLVLILIARGSSDCYGGHSCSQSQQENQ
jgi:hypothetical protein